MKRFSLFFLFAVLSVTVWSQSVPRLSKYDIAETGCKVYLPEAPESFEMTLSEDESEVYTSEVSWDGFNFAVILVKLSEPLGDDNAIKNDLMTSYLDYLQQQFSITESAGYGLGHTLESAPKAVGVIDYWADEEGTRYAIKSWCDGKFLAVMMLYGAEEYPIFNVQQMFLDGFRFPQ